MQEAYAKILALSFSEFKDFVPATTAEEIAYRQAQTAAGMNERFHPTPAAREIADRVDGKVPNADVEEKKTVVVFMQPRPSLDEFRMLLAKPTDLFVETSEEDNEADEDDGSDGEEG